VARVTVEGFGTFDARDGLLLLDACEGAGVGIAASCGGFAACNSCRVDVLHGMDHLSPRRDEEEPFLDAPTHRLACQAEVRGDVTVSLAPG
jgi:ferredoxin